MNERDKLAGYDRLQRERDTLLAACQSAIALLADPDGDAFDATRVEEQLRQAIAKAVRHVG